MHETILEYQLHLDPTDPAHLSQMEKIPCGWVSTLSKISDYNPTTGLHKSLAIDCVHGNPQYWVAKDGTTAKAASPAGPPSWSGAVQGLTQHFEQMSMKGGAQPSERSFLDEASDPPVELHLNHEEVCWEYYTGRHFAVPELVPGVDRHHETRLKLNALGGEFLWTLNHEIVFSTALTGRPKRKAFFSQNYWKVLRRCCWPARSRPLAFAGVRTSGDCGRAVEGRGEQSKPRMASQSPEVTCRARARMRLGRACAGRGVAPTRLGAGQSHLGARTTRRSDASRWATDS